MAWTKTANIKGERGVAGTRSTSVFFNTSSNELVNDLKIDSDGALYVYEVPKTQFATFDNSTGTLRFWNRETVPSVGDKDPEGHNVDKVFTELNYQYNGQSVFNSIVENLKAAIAVDRVSFTDPSYTFYNCQSLTKLDLSNFDTSNVTNMYYMFYNCRSLTTLDVSNFDTSNAAHMGGMFSDCQSLTTLDLSSFDTSKVTDMGYMFYDCSDLTLDCSHWNVDKVISHYGFNDNAPNVIPPVWKN